MGGMDEPTRSPQALVDEFARGYPFELDDFQRRGCLALAGGRGALVAAPTGAGKTVVGVTTEVLRNMLYEGSPTLAGLSHVVMDEVHYLQDRVRGAVWEEVLINLPARVRVASLSATVSNAEEFGEWLEATRGATEVVIEERRPVPLDNFYLIGRDLHPLFATRGDDVVPNPALARRGERDWRPGRDTKGRHAGPGRAVGRGWVPSPVE